MPHGGGHHGGGGGHHGGGGGSHGGGHHHHHPSHHHHHHRHYGGVVYTGGGFYYRSRFRGWIWSGVGITLGLVIILVVSLSVTLSKDENEEKHYAPGDSRIKHFQTFFCRGVKISTSYRFTSDDARAYIITENPPLTARNNFTINDDFSLFEQDYHYWHFYLYENSSIKLSGCITKGSGYFFYIIKGTSKWNDWKDYVSDSKSVKDEYITAPCSGSESGELGHVAEIEYKIEANDHYYIAYYNDAVNEVSGKQTLYLDRFEYTTPTPSSLPNCSFAGPGTKSSCELDVPMNSNLNKVLVILPNAEDSKKEDTFILNVDCSPRAEAYVIVIIPPIIFVLLLVCCAVVGCLCYKKSKKSSYRPLLGATNPTDQSNNTVPPPFNPGYGEAHKS